MKKKNGSSVIFIIPAIVLTLAIGGVFAYKLFSEGTKAKASETPVVKTTPQLQTGGKKPSTGYGNVQGPTAAPTVAAGTTGSGSMDLDTLLDETSDAGEEELKSLDSEAQQL